MTWETKIQLTDDRVTIFVVNEAIGERSDGYQIWVAEYLHEPMMYFRIFNRTIGGDEGCVDFPLNWTWV